MLFHVQIDIVTIGDEKYNLVEFEKPAKGSFIQIETFCKDKNYSRVVHISQTDPAKPQLRLGRGHDADLKVGDISVSRVHAMIVLTPNGYVLQDNASKFGTLMLLPPGPHEISPMTGGLSIQVSRTTLGLVVKSNEALTGKMVSGGLLSEAGTGSPGSPSLYAIQKFTA